MICSVTPIAKLPRPSNCLPLIPRKSRIRGMAIAIRRSRNSYMRSSRSVTLQPIGQPSRILKPAIDLRDLVTTGFWPAIFSMSASAFSSTFLSPTASPTPMFSVILVTRGTSITFERPNSSLSLGAISVRYLSFSVVILRYPQQSVVYASIALPLDL